MNIFHVSKMKFAIRKQQPKKKKEVKIWRINDTWKQFGKV